MSGGQYNNRASVRDLTEDQLNKVLHEADHRCYADMAKEMSVTIGTIRAIVRNARTGNPIKRHVVWNLRALEADTDQFDIECIALLQHIESEYGALVRHVRGVK